MGPLRPLCRSAAYPGHRLHNALPLRIERCRQGNHPYLLGNVLRRMRNAGSEAMKVIPAPSQQLCRGATQSSGLQLIEAMGLMGIGWLFSGRPFIGIMLLGGWISGFLTFMYVVSAIAGGTIIPYFAVIFYTFTLISGFNCYRSYMRDARARLAAVS